MRRGARGPGQALGRRRGSAWVAVRKECVSIDRACSGPSAFLFALSLRYLSALDAGADQVDGLVRLGPAQQLHPFALFQILVMLEEMPDLLEQDLRQIAIGADLLVEWMQFFDGDGDDLLVDS